MRNRLPEDPLADTADGAWAKLQAIYAGRARVATDNEDGYVRQVRQFTSHDAALSAQIRSVLEELDGAPRPTQLDHGREALRAHMIHAYVGNKREGIRELWPNWEWARNLIDFWASTEGLAFCIEVLLRPTQFFFETVADAPPGISLVALVPATTEYYFLRNEQMLINGIRAWLSSQSDDTYARERERAVRAMDVLGPNELDTRVRLAWAFSPRDTSIAEALVEQVLDPRSKGDVRWLYSSLPTATSVLAVCDRKSPGLPAPAAYELVFDIVDAYQEESLPILQRIAKWTDGMYKSWLRDATKLAAGATKKAPATKAAPTKALATKAPAKKTPEKKTPAKKTPAKKAPAKMAPAQKAPAKKAPARSAGRS